MVSWSLTTGSLSNPESSSSPVGDATDNKTGVKISTKIVNTAGRPLPDKLIKFSVKGMNARSQTVVPATILTPPEVMSNAEGYVETVWRSTEAGQFVVVSAMDDVTVETKPITFTSADMPVDATQSHDCSECGSFVGK